MQSCDDDGAGADGGGEVAAVVSNGVVIVAAAASTGEGASFSRRCGHDADFAGLIAGASTPDALWQRMPPSRSIMVYYDIKNSIFGE